MPSTDHQSDQYLLHAQGSSSSSSGASSSTTTTTTTPAPPAPIQAPPITPPPLYALVTPGLHRCSAIGLEEDLNEAWSSVQELLDKDKESAEAKTSAGGSGVGASSSSSSSSNGGGVTNTSGATSTTTTQQPPQPSSSSSITSPETSSSSSSSKTSTSPPPHSSLPLSILSHSPLLSFLSTLHLRTLIYLSPSLLPASLLKLSRDLNLSLLQWDLQGGRVWRIREGAAGEERRALCAFTTLHQQQEKETDHREKDQEEEEELRGLDLTKMCKATLELLLNVHSSGVLLCDPSGLSETSLVIGCLRRMMRWNFASVCLEYRAFAPSRSASTANHLRFVELFPLHELELPQWQHLVPWAARALRSVEKEEHGKTSLSEGGDTVPVGGGDAHIVH